ncbi:MAG: hypothetical protein M3367_15680 [Acidobacteriota bacterium]|nr:hypothetical protein [Acidobacteriota bacterium]
MKKQTTKARNKNINVTSLRRIRFLSVPYMSQMREKLRKDVGNSPQFWIPIECSLLSRYNFVTLLPHSRYIYVAILLHCGGIGVDEIPTDTRFLANIFGVDERTIAKALEELENAKLLVERKKDLKEEIEKNTQTDREIGVCVDNFNSFKSEAENQSSLLKNDSSSLSPVMKIVNENSKGNGKHSQFTIEECMRYVEHCQNRGDEIKNARALATHLYKSGDSDAFILAALDPDKATEANKQIYGEPTIFTDEPCRICFGAKMADHEGKGFRACNHCKNERGTATGFEPEGEHNEPT